VCSTQGFTVRAACLTYNHNIIPFSYLNRLAECPARLHCHTQELLSVSKFYVPISVSYLSFLFFYQDFIYLLCPFIWFPVKYFNLDKVLCFFLLYFDLNCFICFFIYLLYPFSLVKLLFVTFTSLHSLSYTFVRPLTIEWRSLQLEKPFNEKLNRPFKPWKADYTLNTIHTHTYIHTNTESWIKHTHTLTHTYIHIQLN